MTDDGVSVTSDTKSMEILHFYYDPNPAPDGGWTGGVKATLTSAHNLYMGSVEGKHHSRAMYPYIRVIRDREIN